MKSSQAAKIPKKRVTVIAAARNASTSKNNHHCVQCGDDCCNKKNQCDCCSILPNPTTCTALRDRWLFWINLLLLHHLLTMSKLHHHDNIVLIKVDHTK